MRRMRKRLRQGIKEAMKEWAEGKTRQLPQGWWPILITIEIN